MTYHNSRSYVRFPESLTTVPETSLTSASARIDQHNQPDKRQNRSGHQPAVTTTPTAKGK